MSSTYRQYQEARDTAWRALLRLDEKILPVDAEAFARTIGAEVHPWPDPKENQRLWALAQQKRGVCVSLRIRGHWHMFIRESRLDDSQRRFAVAHELGHLLLGHETRVLSPGVRCFASEENQGDLMDDPQDLADYAADIFAIRLLAPACLLHELHIDAAGPIMALCGLPPRAAALRAERMELLNERDVFYTNPLERQVREAFRPYLLSRQKDIAVSPLPAPARSIPLVLPERKGNPPSPEKASPPEERPKSQAVRKQFRYGRVMWAFVLLLALVLLFLLGKRG